jgi:ribosomal protein L37AE/L43A
MRSVLRQCDRCGRDYRAPVAEDGAVVCPHCRATAAGPGPGPLAPPCPFCQSRHYYQQKDFNPVVGIGLVVIGAALVPKTYGLSLPALCLVDWWLYRRVPDLAVCYKCRARFRGFALAPEIQIYNHHTAYYYEQFERPPAPPGTPPEKQREDSNRP